MIWAPGWLLISRFVSSVITFFVLLSYLSAAGGSGKATGAMRAVRLNRPFSLRAGQQVTLKGQRLRIKFVAVEEDSRCPANVTCVWAGNAVVRLELSTSRSDRKSLTLNTARSSTLVGEGQHDGHRVRLLGLNPYPQSDQKIAAHDYVATLLVSKKRPALTVGLPSGTTHRDMRVAEIDRVRLAEAFRIGETLGNQLWPGWNKAPFAVLLVTPEHEFLIRHARPSADFILIGYDLMLQSNVYYRPRTQPQNLLATFPVVGGIPTIVIGQAENTTRKTSTPWVVTVLHEHFHQLQYSQPGYYSAVDALALSRGDNGGMWMLNYPFPYDWPEMKKHFSLLSKLLVDAFQAQRGLDFSTRLSAYLGQREELRKTLSPDDYRYFSFQMWQEGIARYTEYRMAKLVAGGYKPSKAFRSLRDYKSFAEVAEQVKRGILDELITGQLDDYKRVKFYALGAGEGLLLDRINPRWRQRYFIDKFYLDKYFDRTKSSE
jgi:hypothetical protein